VKNQKHNLEKKIGSKGIEKRRAEGGGGKNASLRKGGGSDE